MMHRTITRVFMIVGTSLVVLSGCGNSGSESSATSSSSPDPTESAGTPATENTESPSAQEVEGASAAAAPEATPSKVDTGGELDVNYSFIGMENAKVQLGEALAYVDEDRLRLELVSKGISGVECGQNWAGGDDVASGELVVKVDTRDASTPFAGAAGTFKNFGYTYYYRPEGRDKGTNSGNSGRPDMDTELEITAIDASSVRGRLRIRDQVQGTFTAKVCP